MSKIVKLDFCSLEFKDRVVIAIINEGIHIDYYYSKQIANTCLDYFKDQPFVYLTHRKKSYSVDVTKYTFVNDLKTLKGFGVISTSLSARNAEIENLFISKPFEIFDTIEDALIWAKQVLENDEIES
ncbi:MULTISPECIES: hypothetical protein [Mesoflavibacter]|uniref:STAS/SEC14 domain-containing protein n=1 Tax=Mesoflavibacter profundi TaxID=2708110 RepID=A0ABT4RXI4_9FLAO|nr:MULTISPECIES: hypothetical protein [Mesoflavibacter]MDA0176527.1 hypothetical protein [Mesoflavibacter profundi]QIJ90165.1 hypothetical protein C7H62_2357 [Mesoflavibacter sp. HG96]QIJ92893.1 hypothetical protein C7H56_2357 [Mesoflavibacter sp. HG37]